MAHKKLINFNIFKSSIILPVILLLTISFIFICSITSGKYESYSFVIRQFSAFIFGLICMFFIASKDFRDIKKHANSIYILALLLLLLVTFVGHESQGAQRWIGFSCFHFQPSELSKIALIVILAKYLSDRKGKFESIFDFLPAFLISILPFILIFLQPDLGTALVFSAIGIGLLFWTAPLGFSIFSVITPLLSIVLYNLSFIAWIIFIVFIILILIDQKLINLDKIFFIFINTSIGFLSSLAWRSLHEYQKNRILAFIKPEVDPYALGSRYHLDKSLKAIGSGGIFGKGLFKGSLTQLHFIPAQHTDFIFSAIGEESGFIGSLIMIIALSFLVINTINIARKTTNYFGSYMAIGIASMWIFQFFVNIGMTIGLFPVVGIPMPFVSYGGTSMFINMGALGILLSINLYYKDKVTLTDD